MAKEALITIVRNGKVVMKIIAASDGTGAKTVADKIKEKPYLVISSSSAYTMAHENKFGLKENLTVMSEANHWWSEGGLPLPPIYRETFSIPDFNPLAEDGKGEFFLLVDL